MKKNNNILNITNGDVFNSYISQNDSAVYLPFNEMMMHGKTVTHIASDEFIATRIAELDTSFDEYRSKMKVFDILACDLNEYEEIRLWFGVDSFCQINLLTLLAYLEQIHYTKKVILNIIDDYSFDVLEKNIIVELGIYNELYNEVLVHQNIVYAKGVISQRALDLYFDYISNDGFLANYVKANPNKDEYLLVCDLLNLSKEYGISDIQAINLIKKYRN